MRTEIYTFLALSALAAAVEYWGTHSTYIQFTPGQSVVVAICFFVAATITLTKAISAWRG